MFCQKCGKEITAGSRFCKFCGEDNFKNDEVMSDLKVEAKEERKIGQRKKKRGKAGKRFGIMLLVIVVLVLSLSVLLLLRPEGRFFINLKMDNYEEAIELYEESIDGTGVQNVVDSVLISKIVKIYEQFEKNEIEYTILKSKYESMSKFQSEEFLTEVEKWQQEADILNTSRIAFETAEKYFDNAEYEKAYGYYVQVIESDANYEIAQNKIVETTEKYRDEVLKLVNVYKEDGKYGEAVNLLQHALGVLQSDSDLSQALILCESTYENMLLEKIVKEADAKAEAGDYAGALLIIQEMAKENQENSKLVATRKKYEKAFISSIQSEVNMLVQEDNYNQAISICEEALRILPENEEVCTLLESVNASKPVDLCELKISESGNGYSLVGGKEVVEDTVGNVYSPGNVFCINTENYSDGYAKYYLGKKYKTIKMKVAVLDEDDKRHKNGTMVSFYDEDANEILYTTDYMRRTTAPFEIEVDVSGVDWLYVTATGDYYTFCVTALLINPMLYQ